MLDNHLRDNSQSPNGGINFSTKPFVSTLNLLSKEMIMNPFADYRHYIRDSMPNSSTVSQSKSAEVMEASSQLRINQNNHINNRDGENTKVANVILSEALSSFNNIVCYPQRVGSVPVNSDNMTLFAQSH